MELQDPTSNSPLQFNIQEQTSINDEVGEFSGWEFGVSDHLSPYVSAHNSPLLGPASCSSPQSTTNGDIFDWSSKDSSPHSNPNRHRRAYSDQFSNSYMWPFDSFQFHHSENPILVGNSSNFNSVDLTFPNSLPPSLHPPSITITPSDPVIPLDPAPIRRRARSHSDTSVRYDHNPLDDRRSFSLIRDHVLDLASDHQPRLAKNPATFACSFPQCGKRFTRAYNLRSHQRTHTDERPYECSFCRKAFARQHDRRRHEQLHSGLKAHECAGILPDGRTWGCGKKFARQDALSRHFKSEAGKSCIKDVIATDIDAFLGEEG